MSPATAALLTAVALSSFSMVASVIMPDVAHRMMYDDRPAMVIRDIEILTPFLKSGDLFLYEFDYDRRVACAPPAGSGTVVYRLWKNENGKFERYVTVEHATISYADPLLHHRMTKVEIGPRTPGKYMLQYVAKFTCSGASADQEITGPMMAFEVTL